MTYLPYHTPSFPKVSKIGLYPIVENTHWLQRLLPLGLSSIQLRLQNCTLATARQAIQEGIKLSRTYHTTLWINDFWELALEYGADGVHLGQADLVHADLAAIHQAGLKLGVSAYSEDEIAHAHHMQPSYIGIGPVYATTSKILPVLPHGIEPFQQWCTQYSSPIVAIGGIQAKDMPALRQAGVAGIAVISAITHAACPEQETQRLLTLCQ